MGIETAIALGVGSMVSGIAGMATQSNARDEALKGGQMAAQGAIDQGVATNAADVFNAQVEEGQAANARDIAGASAGDFLRKGSDVVEGAVADQGATGVTGEGSPLMVDADTVAKVALGASRIKAAGDIQAQRLEDDAKLQRFAGQNAIRASYINANTSLLTGKSAATSADAAMWGSASNILSQGSKIANPNFGRGYA